jgi:hypothetical protein
MNQRLQLRRDENIFSELNVALYFPKNLIILSKFEKSSNSVQPFLQKNSVKCLISYLRVKYNILHNFTH